MKTLADSLPKQREQKPPSTALSKKSQAEKEQLTDILGQCFNVLKTYGREPESLADMNKMFQMALENYPHHRIKEAFLEHVKSSNEMPTPADIIAIIDSRSVSPQRYEHSTPEEYERAAESRRNPKTVPWFGKMWGQFTSEDKSMLRAHLVSLGEIKGTNYAKYLKTMGAPDVLSELQIRYD
jgi:hypothetical protein